MPLVTPGIADGVSLNTACPGFDSASGTGISSMDKVGGRAGTDDEEFAIEVDKEWEWEVAAGEAPVLVRYLAGGTGRESEGRFAFLRGRPRGARVGA